MNDQTHQTRQESEMRRGPTYVKDGWVLGHVQCDDPWPSYYCHQIEIIRPASLMESIRWWLFKTMPKNRDQ